MALTDYSGEKLSRSNPLVKKVIEATFPQYTGRKIKARLWTRPMRLENYWDGGTRSFYVAIRINDGFISDFGTDNPFEKAAHEPVDLPAGVILVEHTIFCGKDTGLTIWARSGAIDAPALAGLIEG